MISTFTVMFLLGITVISFTIIGVAYSSGRLGTTDDFLTARGSTGTRILSATFLASFLGVFILFTPPEAGSIGGITTIIGYGIGVASLYIAFLVIGPKIKSYLPEGSTLNDFAQKRYGAKMHLLTVLLSLFYMFVHLVAELTAIGLVAYQLSGAPLSLITCILLVLPIMFLSGFLGIVSTGMGISESPSVALFSLVY